MFIKYIKSILWKVAKHLSYIEEARCLKVKLALFTPLNFSEAYRAIFFFTKIKSPIKNTDNLPHAVERQFQKLTLEGGKR